VYLILIKVRVAVVVTRINNINGCFMLKSTYHGFLKMTVHIVWNIALRK